MSEAQWLGNDAWERVKAFDPLTTSSSWPWQFCATYRRADEHDSYADHTRDEWVCTMCGAPDNAQHLDSCSWTPIWVAMCAEMGNPLHLWAFSEILVRPSFWRIAGRPAPYESFNYGLGRIGSPWTVISLERQRTRPISEILAEIDYEGLTMHLRPVAEEPVERLPARFEKPVAPKHWVHTEDELKAISAVLTWPNPFLPPIEIEPPSRWRQRLLRWHAWLMRFALMRFFDDMFSALARMVAKVFI